MAFRQFWVLVFLLGFAMPGHGQSNYATVAGKVSDAQGLPVVGASVHLTAANTGATRRVATSQQGMFEAAALLPDTYEIRTEASGFAAETQSVRLEVGQKLTLEISLK